MAFKRKHLVGLADVSKEEIELILNTAESFKEVLDRPIPKVPTLRGKTIASTSCDPADRSKTSINNDGNF